MNQEFMMKNVIKQVLGFACASFLLSSTVVANYSYTGYGSSQGYGSNYTNGSYNYSQGYQGSGYQSSYYGQGYGNYTQGYQGYYGGGYSSGMGNQFAYVDNNWIEDQLRFAVTDVNQNRPYGAMQKLQSVSSYVQGFGDSQLYRRLQLAIRLGYKSSLKAEINSIYNDWKGGKMRLGWESGANQSYQGQDDITESYIISQLQQVVRDIDGKQQNRGRQRLMGLQSAIPPQGNDRLIRRVYYASTVNRPSQMKSEVNALIAEIRSGNLVLNDTENNAWNYYYGSGSNPYSQPDQGYPGGGPQTQPPPPYGGGGLPGDGPRYDQGYPGGGGAYTGLPETGSPNPGTIYYPPATGGGSTTDYSNNPYQPQPQPAPADPVATQPPAPTAPVAPQVDVAQLKANVSAAYSKLKTALASGDRDQIMAAQNEYKAAQAAYEAAKQ